MNVVVNGKETALRKNISLLKLLEEMKIQPARVACELNLKIIKRSQYAATQLQAGDRLEILQMIGGG